MSTADVTGLDLLESRDREYVESLDDPELRETIVGTLVRYRRPDRMQVGMQIPALDLFHLESGRVVPLRTLLEERPLALVFGSYT
jgi:hypothetical protein